MVSERLAAVAKDRDNMRKRAQEQARQQGRSYEEIMVRWRPVLEREREGGEGGEEGRAWRQLVMH